MKITFRDKPVHVQFYGEGFPLVLLHGFLESSKIWNDFIPVFKTQNKVICPDLFGHGQTPQFADIHKMEDMADSVAAILDNLQVEKANFIGHSMGGYVTLAFAEKYPERINALLLLNSSSFEDSKDRLEERDQVIRVVQKHKNIMIKSGVKRLFSESNQSKFQEKINELTEEALKISAASIIASTLGMKNRKDRTEVLKSFTGRKWIFAGEEDALIPYKDLQLLAAETDAEFFGFAGGHMSYIEQKEQVLSRLLEFLKP